MTNPGDSDEWWKQYGGEGVSPESGAQGSVPQYPSAGQSGYPSAPQYPQQPPAYGTPPAPPQGQYPPSGPSYPQSPSLHKSGDAYPQQPGYPQQSQPGYPQQPGYPPQPGYPQQGYPVGGGYQPYGPPSSGGLNGMALASMIVSILGLVSCCTVILPVVGLVLGIVATNQMKASGDETGKGMAQAGIWVGVAGIVFNLLYWILNIVGVLSGTI